MRKAKAPQGILLRGCLVRKQDSLQRRRSGHIPVIRRPADRRRHVRLLQGQIFPRLVAKGGDIVVARPVTQGSRFPDFLEPAKLIGGILLDVVQGRPVSRRPSVGFTIDVVETFRPVKFLKVLSNVELHQFLPRVAIVVIDVAVVGFFRKAHGQQIRARTVFQVAKGNALNVALKGRIPGSFGPAHRNGQIALGRRQVDPHAIAKVGIGRGQVEHGRNGDFVPAVGKVAKGGRRPGLTVGQIVPRQGVRDREVIVRPQRLRVTENLRRVVQAAVHNFRPGLGLEVIHVTVPRKGGKAQLVQGVAGVGGKLRPGKGFHVRRGQLVPGAFIVARRRGHGLVGGRQGAPLGKANDGQVVVVGVPVNLGRNDGRQDEAHPQAAPGGYWTHHHGTRLFFGAQQSERKVRHDEG
jgi:hypothetical protein